MTASAATLSDTSSDTANQSQSTIQNSAGGAVDAYVTIPWVPQESGCVGIIEQAVIENGGGDPNIVARISLGGQSFSSAAGFPDPLPTSGTSTTLFIFSNCVNVTEGITYTVDYDWADGDGEGVASASVAAGFWSGSGHLDEFPDGVTYGPIGSPSVGTGWSPVWTITTGGASGISPFTFSATSTAAFALAECAAETDGFVGDLSCAFAAAYADVSQALFGLTNGMIAGLTAPFQDMEYKAPWGYALRLSEAWDDETASWASASSTPINVVILGTTTDIGSSLSEFGNTSTPVGTPREIASYLFAIAFIFYWYERVTAEHNT